VNASLKHAVWGQFGAAIDALENAIVACPDQVWGEGPTPQAFWYLAYHTLFWLDLYLSGTPEGFTPAAPFTLGELDPAGVYPDRIYTKAELQAYLEHSRRKCRATITAMTDEHAAKPSDFERLGLSHAELLLYNLRHVQHHVGQLQLLLRQRADSAPRWVSRTNVPLAD
jgi:hypothetical protein